MKNIDMYRENDLEVTIFIRNVIIFFSLKAFSKRVWWIQQKKWHKRRYFYAWFTSIHGKPEKYRHVPRKRHRSHNFYQKGDHFFLMKHVFYMCLVFLTKKNGKKKLFPKSGRIPMDLPCIVVSFTWWIQKRQTACQYFK